MSHDALKAIEDELARQNEAFASFKQTLESLGDVELQVPNEAIEELDDLAASRPYTPAMPCTGIRA
jgi:hypothetical protein